MEQIQFGELLKSSSLSEEDKKLAGYLIALIPLGFVFLGGFAWLIF